MPLESYFRRTHVNARIFASWFNVSESLVHKLVSGERSPTLDLMMEVERKTKGEISYSQWCQIRRRYTARRARRAG